MLNFKYSKQSLIIFLLGISSGLPILLVFGTLSVWLREAGIERSAISFISWVGLSYGFKFLWAPLIDSSKIYWLSDKLGRRRSWMLLAQIGIIISLVLMAVSNPSYSTISLTTLVIGAVLLSFFSATQDIVIDAYRIETANNDTQALFAGIVVAGYRVGMIIAGAGALEFTSYLNPSDSYVYSAWLYAYVLMALIMVGAIMLTLSIKEPKSQITNSANNSDNARVFIHFLLVLGFFVVAFILANKVVDFKGDSVLFSFINNSIIFIAALGATLYFGNLLAKTKLLTTDRFREIYISPFSSFFETYGKLALSLLAVICLYRCSDIVMGVLAKVFYVDLGFTKTEIARISVTYGLLITIFGGIVGGILAVKYNLLTIYLIGALIGPLSNLVFIYLNQMPEPSLLALTLAISCDNFAGGFASAIAVAFMSVIVNKQFSATQYAAFTSITVLLPKLIAGYSGAIVDSVGYSYFFSITALLGLPAIILIIYYKTAYNKILKT